MTPSGIEPATFRIVDDITTVENIIKSFMTLSDFKLRAQKVLPDDGECDRETCSRNAINVCKLINVGHLVCIINPLNAELNSICHLLALLGAHHILHVSRIRVKKCSHKRI